MKRVLAIALGSRQTSAVLMESTPAGLTVADYCIIEAPPAAANGQIRTVEAYADHFRQVRHALGGLKIRSVVLVLSSRDSMVQLTELPAMPVAALREVLQKNAKSYLKDDYAGYVFDCVIQKTAAPAAKPEDAAKAGAEPVKTTASASHAKVKKLTTVVGGARAQLVDTLVRAGKAAGFRIEQIIPAQLAQLQGLKTPYGGDLSTAVAGFDIGLEHSSICVLSEGELVQCRLVPVGGKYLTAGLAEAMKVTPEAAESVKVLLPNTVDAKLDVLLNPLAQELKASLDYYEAQCEQKISVVFVSGGTARSPVMVELLEKQVHIPCRAWHLADNMNLELKGEREATFKRDMPQLVAAVGAAMDYLQAVPRSVNLLASQLAEAQKRQRSPARLALAGGALLVALMLVWSAVLGWRLMAENSAIRAFAGDVVQRRALETRVFQKLHAENERKIKLLSEQATNRFLVAPALDALQRSVVDDIVVTKITAQRTRLLLKKGAKEREAIVLSIQAKDYSELGATDAFIDAIASNPYFKRRLPGVEAVNLKQRSSRQADTANPARSFALVTIECLILE